MRDLVNASSVVVGIDGSKAATHAAVWAIQEAVGRELPLRLLYFIDPADLGGGKPLAKLGEEARSAAMVCVGSIGMKHACHGTSSVAAALPRLALCPVAVIRRPEDRSASPEVGRIVVEADNRVVLQHAFDEASLRAVPLRAVSAWRANVADDIAYTSRRAQARLNRRIARWTRRYPDVQVEPIAIRGSISRYLATNAKSVELFVTDANGDGNPIGPGPINFPVLTVRRNNL
jgi:hypothetical protein